jgi:hypothetical protein
MLVPDRVYGYPTTFTEYKNDSKDHFSEEIPQYLVGYYNGDKGISERSVF